MDSELTRKLAGSTELGRARRIEDVRARYIEFAKRTLPRNMSFDGLRVVIDCANGAAYKVAPEALWELGAEVIAIGVEPDGFNINNNVGSTHPRALRDKVREMRADVGIALDGDADRVIMIDENGQIIDGDQLMAVVAASWQEQGLLAKPGLVTTIMSNLGLERHLAGLNLKMERTAVGDRYVIERMRQAGYNVGGEQSGHVILSDFSTTGDGLVTAMQVLAEVKRQGRLVSDVCHCFEPLPQILRNVRAQKRALEKASVMTAIEDARKKLGAEGRMVVRASGTEAVIRVMAEGDDSNLVEKLVTQVCNALKETEEAA